MISFNGNVESLKVYNCQFVESQNRLLRFFVHCKKLPRISRVYRGEKTVSMKRIWILSLLIMLVGCLTMNAKKAADEIPPYEIKGGGTGTQGTYLVEVTVTTKDKNVSDDVLKRAAVHGVLFRGFSDTVSRKTQKPLAGSAANEAQHADFYKEFFSSNGNAASFANIVSGSRRIVKADKQYQVTAMVQVNKENLIKYLQDVGVVKGLNSIF